MLLAHTTAPSSVHLYRSDRRHAGHRAIPHAVPLVQAPGGQRADLLVTAGGYMHGLLSLSGAELIEPQAYKRTTAPVVSLDLFKRDSEQSAIVSRVSEGINPPARVLRDYLYVDVDKVKSIAGQLG